jgi:hypothetical protein
MYLTSQRVARRATGAQAVNAFHYAHGGRAWEGPAPEGIPDRDPGTLVLERVELEPEGNRVRSYLDVVAPDGTSFEEIRPALIAFVSRAQAFPMPWEGVVGRCSFRIAMDDDTASEWERELATLIEAIRAVHPTT